MSESRASFDAFLVETDEEFFANRRPGCIYFVERTGFTFLWVTVSSESAETGISVGRLPLNRDDGWTWDGNRERPTLSPSIHAVGHWHGYLRAGRFESC